MQALADRDGPAPGPWRNRKEPIVTHTNASNPIHSESSSDKQQNLDLRSRIRGLYRLLSLVNADGLRNAKHIIISQESVGELVNDIHPGAYTSITKIDFNALDKHTLKPIGVYGSISAIVDFLYKAGSVNKETAVLLTHPQNTAQRPTLSPGLYFLNMSHRHQNFAYIIFWPEETTWDDKASRSVSENRTTFIRFLSKLCDQVVVLTSGEPGESLVFKSDTKHSDMDAADDSGRLFEFEVSRQEEIAMASKQFKFSHPCMAEVKTCPQNFDLERLQPILVAGDTFQAVLSAECIPEQYKKTPIGSLSCLGFYDILKASRSPRLILDENIDFGSLELLRNGLDQRCSRVYQSWRAEKSRDDKLTKQRENDVIVAGRVEEETTLARLKKGIVTWLAGQVVAQYPSLTEEAVSLSISSDPSPHGMLPGDLRYLQAKQIQEALAQSLRHIDDDSGRSRFHLLKICFLQHFALLQAEHGCEDEKARRITEILGMQSNFETGFAQMGIGEDGSSSESSSVTRWPISLGRLTSGTCAADSKSDSKSDSNALSKSSNMDDSSFIAALCTICGEERTYQPMVEEILQEATQSLGHKLKRLVPELFRHLKEEVRRIARQEIDDRINAERQAADLAAKARLRSLIRGALDAEAGHPTNRARVTIRNVSMDTSGGQESYRVDGETIIPLEAGICYKFNVLEVKKQGTLESNYVPQPFIRRGPPPNFTLPPSHLICFVRLIGNDRCLLVVRDPQGVLGVYLEKTSGLGNAVNAKPKKIFYSHKLGPNPLFALDEAKRILVIYASDKMHAQIIPYVYEGASNVLSARGGAINITRWFDGPTIPRMLHATFISGSEELLLVDETGLARIFSLVTEQFRPAVCKLDYVPASVHTVPDGAAFLALGPRSDGAPRLLCYHLASFGSSAAVPIELPESYPNAKMAISCMGQRENPHALFLDCSTGLCSSISLHITSRTSEYDFRAGGSRLGTFGESLFHNSLISCYSDVWTRYPIQAAICRETAPGTKHCPRSITFASSIPPNSFSKYFKALIRDFHQKTRKPTRLLEDIRVAAQLSFDPAFPNFPISQFKTGDWLVGLFCLIPIHIAVTGQNRFIPLCDGVISQEFEQSLLGADVGHIAEALSFGWYESIFASYLARKPVKVVSSMGEQSVGKSYSLNHFVDTSFAGSAMRCTEGVWLSVTPTQDALVVSMDFEGINSIERSAQEDTLLVLFNAAVSNLVLFRNNFALSRDIASSFKGFQSSTKILDPAANPSLFQSTLAIIIKDVIDSDTKEIVNEFSLKFKQIVRDEAGGYFISKLHRGKLDIIPWPVIQSPEFYKMFGSLKTCLEKQPVTHKSAGDFLRVLKMLMAKLKACDWGALDQNLAAQRVRHLTPYIVAALAFGCLDPETRSEPLKNMDTDETIPGPSSEIVFYLSDTKAPITSETCLTLLRSKWGGRHDRFKTSEGKFIAKFNQYLLSIAGARIGQVRTWLEQNTARFAQHPDVQILFWRFDGLETELRSHIVLCGAACGACSLSCLKERQHDGVHDCYTTHTCHYACEFNDQHDGLPVPACNMPAGHNGRHICGEMPHQCGQLCALDSREGCLQKCCKPIDHGDDERHLCATRTHACGAPCGLQVDGKPLCTRKCIADCDERHERHCCALALSCPVKCMFCNSFCSTEDHFHALEDTAVHLCGQEHPCPHPCQMMGICHVETTPQSIESTFIGRHERLQYTKYTQIARRLPCSVAIPPNELKHSGRHFHSAPFHFCNARCEYCDYYCTLPLGHSQLEHSTSHGPMSNTVWFTHGDNDGAVGRKCATVGSGAPMLCSVACKSLGRHIHIDTCRSADGDGVCGGGPGIQHINDPDSNEEEDLITHRIFWQRSGFSDPYSQQEQTEFDLCDHKCGGAEHDRTLDPGAVSSYCILPLFHAPAQQGQVTFNSTNGYVSGDGHAFSCQNPAQMQRDFHIIFLVDKSGSMFSTDHRPLANTPMTRVISSEHDNRYGVALSALYAFWNSRRVAGELTGVRDAYSIVLFDHTSEVLTEGNCTSSPDQLTRKLIGRCNWFGGTNFNQSIEAARAVLERQSNTKCAPVLILLSDGECNISDDLVSDLCRSSVRLGSALSFHAVSFGVQAKLGSLRRMVQIATGIYNNAALDVGSAPRAAPCSYHEPLNTIQLIETFLAIAGSLHQSRAIPDHT